MSRLNPGEYLQKKGDNPTANSIDLSETRQAKEQYEKTGVIPDGWEIGSFDKLKEMENQMRADAKNKSK